jgi:hypothetical protein
MAEPFAKRLQKFFNIGVVKSDSGIADKKSIVPKTTDDNGMSRKVKLTPEIQKLWDWYNSETSDNSNTLGDRLGRYKDIDYMIFNDSIIAQAIDLYADETAQADNHMRIVDAKAKDPKVAKEILDLFDKWGVNQSYIRDTSANLVAYGDSVDVLDYTPDKGIIGITPVDVYSLTKRLEFKATEVKKMMKGKGRKDSILNYSKFASIKDLVDSLEMADSKEISKNYRSYLLGFIVDDMFLPPWAVMHHRLISRKSEFWPYGRPLFINNIGPFRQLKASKNMMAMTRVLKFPKEIYSVKTSENMTEVEQWEAVNQCKQEFQNIGIVNKNKEEFSIGSEIWIPEGLLTHDTVENNLSVDEIHDVELLRDDLIMGTGIPKGYLLPDQGNFGVSGQSLLQQSKPFGRRIFSIQSAILENLTHLVRLHFLMTEKHEKEFTEFELSMNFPIVEEASDRQRMKQDSLRFANDIIDGLKNALGAQDTDIPPEVVKSVFKKFSFLEPEDVDLLIKQITDRMKANASSADDTSTDYGFESEEGRRFHEAIRKQLLDEEIIYSQYFDTLKEHHLTEGILGRRHYLVSSVDRASESDKITYSFIREEMKMTKEKLQEVEK